MVRRRAAHRRGRRLHDQPLARGGVAQPLRDRREPDGEGDSPDRRSWSRRRCPTRSCRRWTSTSSRSTSSRSTTTKAITKYNGADRRRLRPVHAHRVQEGPVRALQGQPELLGRQAGDRRGRDPRVQQRRRDGRGAQARRDRLRPGRPRGRVPRPREDTGIETIEGSQGGFDEFALNGGDGLKKGHPALGRPAGARGDRARDRQADDRRPRRARPGHAGRRDQPVGEPGVDAGDPGGPAVRLRPRQGEPDPRRRRLRGHRRRRRARDAGRRPAAADALRGALGERRRRSRSPSSSPAGSRRSGSPRRRRPTTTGSSPR